MRATERLRNNDNIKPILYIENSDLQGNAYRSKFIDDKKLLDDNSTDWSKDISLNLPVLNGKNVAYYAKLCYYRQVNNINVHKLYRIIKVFKVLSVL